MRAARRSWSVSIASGARTPSISVLPLDDVLWRRSFIGLPFGIVYGLKANGKWRNECWGRPLQCQGFTLRNPPTFRIAFTSSSSATRLSLIALCTSCPSPLPLPGQFIFLIGAGRFIPVESFCTHRISCRFSNGRLRDALDASSSSRRSYSAFDIKMVFIRTLLRVTEMRFA